MLSRDSGSYVIASQAVSSYDSDSEVYSFRLPMVFAVAKTGQTGEEDTT
jgi:hypothetical protein